MKAIRAGNKQNQIVFFAILSIFCLLHIYIALSPRSSMMNWYLIDDAFYYFQVARHIIAGHGVTFDGINPTNGFHPLWMLLNLPVFAMVGQANFLPLRLIILLSALITLGSGVLLYQLIKSQLSDLSALLVLTVWLFYFPLHRVITQSGMETTINAFFVVLMLYLANKLDLTKTVHILWFGLAGALTLLSRIDNIFFVMLIGAWIVFRERPMRVLILIDIFSIFVSVFMALVLRLGPQESLLYLSPAYILLICGLVLRLVFFSIFGLYSAPRNFLLKNYIGRYLMAIFSSAFPIIAILLLGMKLGWFGTLPRTVLLYDVFIFSLLSGSSRLFLWLYDRDPNPPPIDLKTRWRSWFSSAALYLAPVGILFGAYIVWNLTNFGTGLPVSGQIKQWWGTLANTVYGKHQESLFTILGLDPTFTQIDPWQMLKRVLVYPILDWFVNFTFEVKLLIGALLFIFYTWLLLLLIRTQKILVKQSLWKFSIPPLLIAGLLQPFVLSVIGYLHARSWYWVTQMVLMILIFSILCEIILRLINRKKAISSWTPLFVYGLISVILFVSAVQFYRVFPPTERPENMEQFTGISQFLEKNTESGILIGMTGGGLEAFFLDDRTIVNMDGLINSYEYFQMMQDGQAELYLDRIGLDYVFGNPIMLLESDPYWWYFTGRLEAIAEYGERGTLYRYLNTGEDVNP